MIHSLPFLLVDVALAGALSIRRRDLRPVAVCLGALALFDVAQFHTSGLSSVWGRRLDVFLFVSWPGIVAVLAVGKEAETPLGLLRWMFQAMQRSLGVVSVWTGQRVEVRWPMRTLTALAFIGFAALVVAVGKHVRLPIYEILLKVPRVASAFLVIALATTWKPPRSPAQLVACFLAAGMAAGALVGTWSQWMEAQRIWSALIWIVVGVVVVRESRER